MKRTITALATLLTLAAAVSAFAWPQSTWVRLATRTVTDRPDHDRIVVSPVRGDFTALRIGVARRAVEVRNVKVVFGDGSVQHLKVRAVIPAGGSRTLDVAGGDRVIRRLELDYDAQSLGGSATVTVWGRR